MLFSASNGFQNCLLGRNRGYSMLKHCLLSMDDTLISPVQYLPKRHATMMLQGKSGFCSLINKSI